MKPPKQNFTSFVGRPKLDLCLEKEKSAMWAGISKFSPGSHLQILTFVKIPNQGSVSNSDRIRRHLLLLPKKRLDHIQAPVPFKTARLSPIYYP
jgi:hypothetical protein